MFDYSAVTAETIGPDLEATIAESEAILEKMVSVEGPRTFANTMMPLEAITALTSDCSGQGIWLAQASPDEGIRNAGREAQSRLSSWTVELVFRRDLYEAVSAFAGTDEAAALEGEARRMLDHWQRDLRRAGHELPEDVRTELKELNQRLVDLGIEFNKNVAEYQDALIVTPDDLAGTQGTQHPRGIRVSTGAGIILRVGQHHRTARPERDALRFAHPIFGQI